MSPALWKQKIIARRLTILSILVGLSLITTIALFLLFGELNSAIIEKPTLKLGGPVAAFFAILYLLWRIYKGVRLIDNPLELRLQPLVGQWRIESTSLLEACSHKLASGEMSKVVDLLQAGESQSV